MAYHDLPILTFDVVRGMTQRVHYGIFTKNGVVIDWLTSNVRIYFKAAIDNSRAILLKKTLENEGLTVNEDNELTLHIKGSDFLQLADDEYFGDIYCRVDGDDKIISRIRVRVSGTVTTD